MIQKGGLDVGDIISFRCRQRRKWRQRRVRRGRRNDPNSWRNPGADGADGSSGSSGGEQRTGAFIGTLDPMQIFLRVGSATPDKLYVGADEVDNAYAVMNMVFG